MSEDDLKAQGGDPPPSYEDKVTGPSGEDKELTT
jgi:hypothetical protein